MAIGSAAAVVAELEAHLADAMVAPGSPYTGVSVWVDEPTRVLKLTTRRRGRAEDYPAGVLVHGVPDVVRTYRVTCPMSPELVAILPDAAVDEAERLAAAHAAI